MSELVSLSNVTAIWNERERERKRVLMGKWTHIDLDWEKETLSASKWKYTLNCRHTIKPHNVKLNTVSMVMRFTWIEGNGSPTNTGMTMWMFWMLWAAWTYCWWEGRNECRLTTLTLTDWLTEKKVLFVCILHHCIGRIRTLFSVASTNHTFMYESWSMCWSTIKKKRKR